VTLPAVDRSAAERITIISERLAVVRAQTVQLSERAQLANMQARDVRTRQVCTHEQQVEQVRVALDAAEQELAGLHTAMLTRGVIEQAKGMLMLHRQCDSDTAFSMLVELSQHSHRKLVEVAQALVASWSSGHAPA
jgi:hypothetical protein